MNEEAETGLLPPPQIRRAPADGIIARSAALRKQ